MIVIVPRKAPRRKLRTSRRRERERQTWQQRRRRALDRIAHHPAPERQAPMLTATNIQYELADRVQGISAGGIGLMLLLAHRIGLIRDIDANLLVRVYGEFIEMPGLQLTVPQASRLWSVDSTLSAQVLNQLVDASFLRRSGSCYVRADSGRVCA